ncbi:MAG TPA: hypothetical protein VLR52_05215 [Bacteroidales bacterium]|nr:hypothetical protein [Bacteroidales bacterium]
MEKTFSTNRGLQPVATCAVKCHPFSTNHGLQLVVGAMPGNGL